MKIPPPELKLYRRISKLQCHKWQSIGPYPGEGFSGIGRVTQIDVDQIDSNIVIAGTAGGGVWSTTDAGEHWIPLMEDEPTLTIGAVSFAASNSQVIYAASGEDAGRYNPAWPGVGIYRSTNGGSTWTLGAPVSSTRFSAVVAHPTQPNTILVAGDRGLHRSSDGGATWITNPGLTSIFDGHVTDVVFAHDNPDLVYIGVWNDGVYRSSTGGVTSTTLPAFEKLSRIKQLPSGVQAGWIKLDIGRKGKNGSKFLVAKLGDEGSRIFTTSDGGNSWTEQAAGVASVDFDEWASVIAVDPKNENRLYAGGSTTLALSNDGGQTWESIMSDLVHPDQQDIAFDNNDTNIVYLANDGGIYRSPDAGRNWFFKSGNMRTTQIYDIDISQRDAKVLACGAQDNGIYYRNAAGVWGQLPFGWDGTQVAIDPTDPSIIYFSSQNGISNSVDTPPSGGLSRSTDGGITVIPLGTSGLSGDSPWETIIKLDPTDPIVDPADKRIIFVCGNSQLFRSKDGGVTWQRVNDSSGNPFNTNGNITALEFAPSDPSVLYMGTDTGALYSASTGGITANNWRRIDTGGTPADMLFPNTQISAICVDPNDSNHVWIVFAGTGVSFLSRPNAILNPLGISHVFKTNDGGINWEDASGRFVPLHLPDVPTSAVSIDNRDSDIVYVGTDVGVFKTSDGGNTWTSFHEGLPSSPVTELRLHRLGRSLFAATMGRGVYRCKLD